LKVWKESRSLGIGMARIGDGYVVVCNYFNAGNVDGEFETNVRRPLVGINFKRDSKLGKLFSN
jgi:hypothetical protein